MLEMINQKYMNFLLLISNRPRNVSELAKKGDLTCSFASILITRWARSNVVIKTKSDGNRGKEIIITLTDYGKAQVKLLKEIQNNYNENKSYLDKFKSLDVSLEHTDAITKIENSTKEVKDGTRNKIEGN